MILRLPRLAGLLLLLPGFAVFPETLFAQESGQAAAEEERPLPAIETRAAGWNWHAGFQPFYSDEDTGRIWLKISDWDREFLFSWGLGTGLGSNPVGLDRGQLGDQLVCQFRRSGRKVFLVARNLDYRALSDNAVERRAVRESFAESILWGGKVAAADETAVLVDVTDLLTRDLHGIAGKLKQAGQGEYQLDETRCGVYPERCKAFPLNTELEATLTFSGPEPGPLVAEVTPSPKDITLRQHLSFVQLPDDGYRPRRHHPRCASMYLTFSDYAAPIADRLQKRWILRHRLQKTDPNAERSTVVEPIVYHVDPGAPELIREALIDGARWWNAAFEAAGFIDAFQVRVLPADADPMDVRYNVIQWVHRSTRGWSYGGSVIDPRTGEIIKGHVTLGSLRVRQDRLLFESLGARGPTKGPANRLDPQSCGLGGVAGEATLATISRNIDPVQVALARIRQLSAHEVGHTLGFVHNFAASTFDDRASVMDYPAPRVRITEDGQLDLSGAYGVGIGTWDVWSVRYAYQQFAPGQDESRQLSNLVQSAIDDGMTFVSDADARPPGAAHPLGNLWDNGSDPIQELQHVMRVRRIALNRLRPDVLPDDEALGEFQQWFVPLFLYHRYQVDAVAKMIGGVQYGYEVAAGGSPMQAVPSERQRAALRTLLATLDLAELLVADETWQYLLPPSFESHRKVERLKGSTDPVFDREACARVAADLTIGNLLQPQRVSRLAMTRQANDEFGPQQLVADLVDHVWRQRGSGPDAASVGNVLKQSLTEHLLRLWAHPEASPAARAAAGFGIDRVKQYLQSAPLASDATGQRFASNLFDQIRRFESRPYPEVALPDSLPAPPGSPIGNDR
jgi:hypothetical protein